MTRRRLIRFVLPAIAVVVTVVGVALAFWSSSGSGSPTISVATLPAPANVTATVTPGSSTVSVDWDAATLSTGDAVDGYYVTKTDQSNTTTAACGSSSSSLITASTDCSDTSVPDGVYTYKVVAVYKSWTGTGTAGDVTHVATETDPPSANITFPANGGTYNANGFDNLCTTAGFCGTASDAGTGASGVHTVQLEIQQGTGNYFDGSGFNDPSPHFVTASFDSGAGTWSYGFDHTKFPADGTYTATVKATDWAGNDSSTISHTFNYDTAAPSLSSLVMQDTNHNGKVDHVVATFNEDISSSGTSTTPWHLSNVPSGGSLNTVSISGSTATLNLTEGTGSADTTVGSFTVALDADSSGIKDGAGNQSSFSAQAPTDGAAPAVTSMVMQDQNGNGKVDHVALTFSENLDSYSASNSVWTLANVPSGGSLNDVSVSGNTATLNLTEGSGAADTSVGTFTVALSADPAGIRDAAGNQTSFAATAPSDGAAPVRTSLQMLDSNSNGKVDQVVATYTENLANYTAGTAPWNLQNIPSNGTFASAARGSGGNQNKITLTITEGAGAADTSVGSFTVAYTAGSTAARDTAGNQAVSVGAAAPSDAAPPIRTSMVMQDLDGNGKVDRVALTFSENLASYTAPNSVWTLANAPGGATLNTVDVSGNTVNLNLNEGSVATGVGSFTVALASNAAGIRDAADNRSSFAATAPTDGAAPIRTGLSVQDGNADGHIDKVVATYSENVASTTDATLWTFAGTTPGGGSKGTVTSATNAVTINITGTGVDTSVPGDFTVAYTAGSTGVKDSAGNQAASAAAAAPADAAPPIRTSLVMRDSNSNGKVDQVVASYSENVASTTDAARWTLANIPGGGTKGNVSSSGNQVTIAITEGSANTAVGTFTVAYTAASTGVTDAANNQSPAITATAPTDGAAPVQLSMAMQDANANGKVDRIQSTYSEPIVTTSPDASLWSLGGTVPSGGTKGALTLTGSTANLAITEGAGAADTTVGTLTVSYTAGATGIRDSAGNQAASFSGVAPSDGAGPVPTAITDVNNGATDGKFEAGDSMTVTFSENITGLPPTSNISLVNQGGTGNGSNATDGMIATGLVLSTLANNTTGAADLGSTGYITANGPATFNSSTVAQTAGNNTFTVTLGTQGGTGTLAAPSTTPNFTYVPASTITDSSGNAAAGSKTVGIKLF